MSVDIEIVALEALVTQAVQGLRLRGRNDDAGSLLKIGRFEARLRAVEALPAGDVRRALLEELRLDVIGGFPATLYYSFNPSDEDLHLAFEAIGRRTLAGENLS